MNEVLLVLNEQVSESIKTNLTWTAGDMIHLQGSEKMVKGVYQVVTVIKDIDIAKEKEFYRIGIQLKMQL